MYFGLLPKGIWKFQKNFVTSPPYELYPARSRIRGGYGTNENWKLRAGPKKQRRNNIGEKLAKETFDDRPIGDDRISIVKNNPFVTVLFSKVLYKIFFTEHIPSGTFPRHQGRSKTDEFISRNKI